MEHETPYTKDLERHQWKPLEDQESSRKPLLPQSLRRAFKIIIPLSMLFLANYLYLSADITCPYPKDAHCYYDFIKPSIQYWIIQFGTSVLLFSLIIFLGFSQQLIPRNFSILAVASVIYLTFFYNRSDEHGNYPIVRESNQIFFGGYYQGKICNDLLP